MNGGEGIEEGWRRAGRWDETASTTMERSVCSTPRDEVKREIRARARIYMLTGVDHGGGEVGGGGGGKGNRDDSEV